MKQLYLYNHSLSALIVVRLLIYILYDLGSKLFENRYSYFVYAYIGEVISGKGSNKK